MKRNMGSADRFIRALIAVGIAILYFTGVLSGTLALILGIIAIIFLLTSLTGLCLLYIPFKMKTNKEVNTAKQ